MAISDANKILLRTHAPTVLEVYTAAMADVREDITPTADTVQDRILGTSTDDRNIVTSLGLLKILADNLQ